MSHEPEMNSTASMEWRDDPFAEPRTIPSGWDLSEMFKSGEEDSRSWQAVNGGADQSE